MKIPHLPQFYWAAKWDVGVFVFVYFFAAPVPVFGLWAYVAGFGVLLTCTALFGACDIYRNHLIAPLAVKQT